MLTCTGGRPVFGRLKLSGCNGGSIVRGRAWWILVVIRAEVAPGARLVFRLAYSRVALHRAEVFTVILRAAVRALVVTAVVGAVFRAWIAVGHMTLFAIRILVWATSARLLVKVRAKFIARRWRV